MVYLVFLECIYTSDWISRDGSVVGLALAFESAACLDGSLAFGFVFYFPTSVT